MSLCLPAVRSPFRAAVQIRHIQLRAETAAPHADPGCVAEDGCHQRVGRGSDVEGDDADAIVERRYIADCSDAPCGNVSFQPTSAPVPNGPYSLCADSTTSRDARSRPLP